MSITAVPIRPIAKGTLAKFWIGTAAVVLLAAGLAVAGTREVRMQAMPAAEYLTHNGKRSGVTTTASGLQYEVLREGNGPRPQANAVVQVHYIGKLRDGTVFDSSYERGQPAMFPLNAVIPGWSEGVQQMPVGSKYRLWMPPELGYGAEGAGGVIPPNAVLEFDVELLQIVPVPVGAMPGMAP